MNLKPHWSLERVEKVRMLAEKMGMSAGQIAKCMKVTRNTIIGQCRRNGIAVPNCRIMPRIQIKRPRQKTTVAHLRLEPLPDPTLKLHIFNAEASISLLDALPDQCRFPIGEVRSLRCCGAKTVRSGVSYCREHYRICYGRGP